MKMPSTANILRAILFVAMLILFLSIISGMSGCSDEPRPPFFGDYGNCTKQTPESHCVQWQYPNGDGPLFQQEWKQYKEEHAAWHAREVRRQKLIEKNGGEYSQ